MISVLLLVKICLACRTLKTLCIYPPVAWY